MSRVLCFLLIFVSQISLAQQAAIRGKVFSHTTSENLLGATVLVQGTQQGAVADLDGNFSIDHLSAGTYHLICSYVSYQPDTLKNITLKDGEVKVINFSLKDEYVSLQTAVVEATAIRNNETYMLAMKQKSAVVMEGISAQEISKKGDSDVASAAKRITGVTIEGGKYLYVRGLSDRYSKTTLNSAEIPGLDPNRNTVQMDLFPTNLIENMSVYKSFSPDLPADFTGGLVNIETKDFPEQQTVLFSSSLSYNTLSSFRSDFLTYQGGNLDNLGMDDGTRAIPTEALTKIPALFADNQKLENITRSFNKIMSPDQGRSFFDHRQSFSFGNQKKVFGRTLGYFMGLTYSKSYTQIQKDALTARYSLSGNYDEVDFLNVNRILHDHASTENVLWGVLGNMSYKISDRHKISVRFMRNQNGIDKSSIQTGELPFDAPGIIYQARTISYQQRSLNFSQIQGEHVFPALRNLKIDWFGAYTTSEQLEPDLRYFNNHYELVRNNLNEVTDTLYNLQSALYVIPSRFYRQLNESGLDAKASFQVDLNPLAIKKSILKGGFSLVSKERIVRQNRYNYQINNVDFNGNVPQFLSTENMQIPQAGEPSDHFLYIANATELRNNYYGLQNTVSAYLMSDAWLTQKIRVIGGARLEQNQLEVISDDKSLPKGHLNNTDILPSINTTYALTEKQNLRFAYNKTLARPSFREVAPFADYDFATNWTRVGNAQLQRTKIDNLDLRWEYYPQAGEVVSVSAFYKNFFQPIEVILNPKASNATPEITWINVGTLDAQQNPRSVLYGLEFEARKALSQKHPFWSAWFIGANVSLIQSSTEIDSLSLLIIRAGNQNASSTRPMFGQSPYIVNGSLEYHYKGLTAGLSYNVSGPRLAVVMRGGTPDVYEQPVHQLDFKLDQNINDKLSLSFGFRNILDPLIKMTHDFKGQEYIFNSYRRGRAISLGLKYRF